MLNILSEFVTSILTQKGVTSWTSGIHISTIKAFNFSIFSDHQELGNQDGNRKGEL